LPYAAAANQGRNLLGVKKGKRNNQAAQATDQSKFFGGGINQGQAGKREMESNRLSESYKKRE
jgi:hypothetical protein